MRTNLTTEDIKNIVDIAYNGFEGDNPNDEDIILVEEDGTQKQMSLANYLGINFYAYKERVEGTYARGYQNYDYDALPQGIADWISSINTSFDKAYALVERLDEDVTASQDIDAGMLLGQITFLVQTNKVKNFEYYHNKVKNHFLGNPQVITNAFGNNIHAYILLGTPKYDEAPVTIQIGECVVITCPFKINYLGNAMTYNDYKFSMSLTGDDTYNEQGEIVGDTKFLTVPITQASIGAIFSENALTTYDKPEMTGFVNASLSQAKVLSFYDFNVELVTQINEIFWGHPAYRINGILQTTQKEINIPVFFKVEHGGKSYVYKDVITSIQKQFTNSDFVVTNFTIKGFGKIVA